MCIFQKVTGGTVSMYYRGKSKRSCGVILIVNMVTKGSNSSRIIPLTIDPLITQYLRLTLQKGWPRSCLHPTRSEESQARVQRFSDSPTLSAETCTRIKDDNTEKGANKARQDSSWHWHRRIKDTVTLSQSSGSWLCTASAAPPGSPARYAVASSPPPCPAASDPRSPQPEPYLGMEDEDRDIRGEGERENLMKMKLRGTGSRSETLSSGKFNGCIQWNLANCCWH